MLGEAKRTSEYPYRLVKYSTYTQHHGIDHNWLRVKPEDDKTLASHSNLTPSPWACRRVGDENYRSLRTNRNQCFDKLSMRIYT